MFIEISMRRANVSFMLAVLRYSSFNQEITKVIRSGELGELVNVVHIEPVGHWHFAHSYVRGNWSRYVSRTLDEHRTAYSGTCLSGKPKVPSPS